jgi:hypothetical protein
MSTARAESRIDLYGTRSLPSHCVNAAARHLADRSAGVIGTAGVRAARSEHLVTLAQRPPTLAGAFSLIMRPHTAHGPFVLVFVLLILLDLRNGFYCITFWESRQLRGVSV